MIGVMIASVATTAYVLDCFPSVSLIRPCVPRVRKTHPLMLFPSCRLPARSQLSSTSRGPSRASRSATTRCRGESRLALTSRSAVSPSFAPSANSPRSFKPCERRVDPPSSCSPSRHRRRRHHPHRHPLPHWRPSSQDRRTPPPLFPPLEHRTLLLSLLINLSQRRNHLQQVRVYNFVSRLSFSLFLGFNQGWTSVSSPMGIKGGFGGGGLSISK